MKIILLFISLFITIACKNNSQNIDLSKTTDNVTPIIQTVVNKPKPQVKNTCIEYSKVLKLPIIGGDSLMIMTIEEGIESQELKCDVNKIKSKLCNPDFISYYPLPKKDFISPIIISDECGDNNSYTLAIYKGNEMTDSILIYNSWVEMSDNTKKEITDFEISRKYEIVISKKEYQNTTKTKEELINYRVDENGKIVAL